MPVRIPGFNIPFHGVPAGTVIAFASATAPKGWLACDGTAVSRTTYARLFAVTGTTYGVGDGSTTFNLPDCTGRAIYGKESSETRITTANSGINGGTLGASGGDERLYQHLHAVGTIAAANESAHTHAAGTLTVDTQATSSAGGTANTTVETDTAASGTMPVGGTSAAGSAHTHTLSGNTANTGGNTTSQNMPPAIVLYYIIKF